MWKPGLFLLMILGGIWCLFSCQPPSLSLPFASDNRYGVDEVYLRSQTDCPAHNDQEVWGGITCVGGSDQSFKNFISSGTLIEPYAESDSISCEPGNGKGVLFKLNLKFKGKVNLYGDNQNVTLDAPASQMEIRVHSLEEPENQLPVTLNGHRGYVSGTQVVLVFADSKGSVTLEGSFASGTFTGQASFDNEKQLVALDDDGYEEFTAGLKGVLGQFKIATCGVFPQ